MEPILLYASLFVVTVMKAVDALSDWLTGHGFPPGVIIITFLGVVAFNVLDKWLIEMGERLQAIESKLGIEPATAVKKKSSWGKLLA
jgi:hypothetical protein